MTAAHVEHRPSARPRPESLAVDLHGIGDPPGLALLVADALESTVHAVLAHDAVGLRRVLRRSRVREAAQRSAEGRLRRDLVDHPPRSGNLRAVASRLALISELGHISDLVDLVARSVAADPAKPVPVQLRRDLRVLRTFGTQRLRCIAAGLPRPVMDATYLRAGSELRAVAERNSSAGSDLRPGVGRARGLDVDAGCSAIAASTLLASRYATRTA